MDVTGNVIYQAVAATTLVKAGVDLIKIAWGGDAGRTPTWVPPLAATISGLGIMTLLAIANSQDLTQAPVAAQTALAGIMAAVSAVGVTELHKIARPPGVNGWAGTPELPLSSLSSSYSPPLPPIGASSFASAPATTEGGASSRSIFG